ncbi:MAG: patatin-like phospholipase family protein [Rhodoblastus sp.]|nr:MAG: patatin-like phospholipase family protein [Rhodoblastus sp.]
MPLPSLLRPDHIAAIKARVAAYPCVALALQGGGALGSYQAGVMEALTAAEVAPTQVVGVSIGAINSALIAGNPPERRMERITQFWERVTAPSAWWPTPSGEAPRRLYNLMNAGGAMLQGAPGFFTPRFVNPWFVPSGWSGATSFYDTARLRDTLSELIDWDLLNDGPTRIAVGAVDVRSGNFRYFDSKHERLAPEHVMASGALPPGFPGIEIDGALYWDGGLVSNTPLQYLLEFEQMRDTLVFQVDLFSARGEARDMPGVLARQKEILYSSRTRNNTDAFRRAHVARARLRDALKRLPAGALTAEDRAFLAQTEDTPQITILHLIYQTARHESDAQDYEFSRASMLDHWAAGRADTVKTLSRPERLDKPSEKDGVRIFDVHHPREDIGG